MPTKKSPKDAVTSDTPADAAAMAAKAQAWFAAQLPDGWFSALVVRCDKDELVVVGTIPPPETDTAADPAVVELAELEQAAAFREATREGRVGVALRAEALFERKVSWVVQSGSTTKAFTTLALPAMTRLGFDEREVLDTLVAGGVAKSRSEALNWCVQLVAREQSEWLDQLRAAVGGIDAVRAQGPG